MDARRVRSTVLGDRSLTYCGWSSDTRRLRRVSLLLSGHAAVTGGVSRIAGLSPHTLTRTCPVGTSLNDPIHAVRDIYGSSAPCCLLALPPGPHP